MVETNDTLHSLYQTRKENLHRLVLEKFGGNKAALARQVETHPNHINLLLSNNPGYARNLGEDLARKIELCLGLLPAWLDAPQGSSATATRNIPAHPIDASLSTVLRTSNILSMTVKQNWLTNNVHEASALENLFTATVATDALSPILHAGDTVLVDGGVTNYTSDGTYLLISKAGPFLRHVKLSVTGSYVLTAGDESETLDSLNGLTVAGQLLRRMPMIRL